MECKKCKAQLMDHVKYCHNCGAKVSLSSTESLKKLNETIGQVNPGNVHSIQTEEELIKLVSEARRKRVW